MGDILPSYKYKMLRQEQGALFLAIINSLPSKYDYLKDLSAKTTFLGLNNWDSFPDFKFITQSYPEQTLRQYTKKGLDFKLSGIKILSKLTNDIKNAELLINQGHPSGLKISNVDYEMEKFDLSKIDSKNVIQSDFEFPPNEVDLFYKSMNPMIKDKIDPLDFFDIQLGNRTFYTICDLEDGNYLAIDKKFKVYSLIHDAVPSYKLMKISLEEILNDIASGKFDKGKHVEERYNNNS